jgi:hypothetical protein
LQRPYSRRSHLLAILFIEVLAEQQVERSREALGHERLDGFALPAWIAVGAAGRHARLRAMRPNVTTPRRMRPSCSPENTKGRKSARNVANCSELAVAFVSVSNDIS